MTRSHSPSNATVYQRFAVIAAAAIVLALSATTAQAVSIISNYPAANSGQLSTIAISGGAFSKAAGFTMPAQDYALDSAIVQLDARGTVAIVQFDLFADSGGNPTGSSLLSFVVPALTLGIADYTLTPANSFLLAAGQTYWLVGTGTSAVNTDGVNWAGNSPNITPTGIATTAGYRFDNNGIYPPTSVSSVLNTYQINGTLVSAAIIPEPATASLALLTFTGLLLRRRRLA